MKNFHLFVVFLTLIASDHAFSRRRGPRTRPGPVPAGSSNHWYQEGRMARTITSQPYIKSRPAVNGSSPVKVQHSLALIAITDYRPVGHFVTFRANVRQMWTDLRLTWDQKEVTINKLHLRSEQIWTPETEIFPSLENHDYISHDKHDVIVMSEGSVIWAYDVTYRVPCIPTNFTSAITCSLGIWTPNYEANEVAVLAASDVIILDDYITSGTCAITGSRVEQELLDKSPELFSVVHYSFTFDVSAFLSQ